MDSSLSLLTLDSSPSPSPLNILLHESELEFESFSAGLKYILKCESKSESESCIKA